MRLRKAVAFTLAAMAVPPLLASAVLLWLAERARGPLKGER